MELPSSDEINIPALSASFKWRTNSYKYYWFWAILDTLKNGHVDFISYEDMAMNMLDLVWYPLDYYKLSFGKQDSFKLIAAKVSAKITVNNSAKGKPIHEQIKSQLDQPAAELLIKEITDILRRYVSHRFLSSFFPNKLRGVKENDVNGKIKNLCNESPKDSVPYIIHANGIRLSEKWSSYFLTNYLVLKGYVKWELVGFLQTHNPYVIGLSEKLEKPEYRDLKSAKTFWSDYITEHETRCIYSGTVLNPRSISLDHFIPWSYVVHDKLWNIIPTTRSVNASKNDLLPSMELYFNDFCALQYNALTFHRFKANNYLEDYIHLFDLDFASFGTFKNKLKAELDMNIRSAKGLGFIYPFTFRNT